MMIETARSSVQAGEIDQMGHMNIQFYVDRATDGLAAIAHMLGVDLEYTHDNGAYFVATQRHIRFLHERRQGTPFFLRGGVLDAATTSIKVYQEMVDPVSDQVAATFVTDVELRRMSTHEPCTIPDGVREKATRILVEQPAYSRAKGLDLRLSHADLTLDRADAMGMIPTFQGLIRPEQCDLAGRLTPRHFMGIISNGFPNILMKLHAHGARADRNIGGAALEYHVVYRSYPRCGDVVALRSAAIAINEKIYVWCHWLFDLDTGKALSSAEHVSVMLDLTARKAIPISEEVRAKMELLLVPGLAASSPTRFRRAAPQDA